MAADLTPTLKILLGHRTLTAEESRHAFSAMMSGEATDAEMGAMLGLLAQRVPTSDELLGAARVMREHVDAVPIQTDPEKVLDTCGTGGAPKTFNVSTAAAIVAAAAGAHVAKHGNRSRTGRGSAELLKDLGVNVDASRETQAACLDETGICFCFAIHHHPAIKNVMPVRMALGVPTIFNLLGPLTNPAGARRQLLGVYDARFQEPMAGALRALGSSRALVVHSEDGLDELSITAPTHLVHVDADGIRAETLAPEDVGLKRAPREAVVARDLEHATKMVRDIISGVEQGAPRDMTLLSTGAALWVAGEVDSIADGVQLGRETLDTGRAQTTLDKLVARSAQD